MQPSKIVKRLLKSILFVAIFISLTILLDSAFELDETKTEEMLVAYSNTPEIGTVFVGNSAGEMLDAGLYTKLSKEPSFNMCTPSQGLSVSLKNIKLARSHHMIKKAVLLTTPDMFDSESYDAIDHLYDRTVDSSSPFFVRIKRSVERNLKNTFKDTSLNDEKTINIWIPWENENIHGYENIKGNLARRFTRFKNRQPLGYKIAFDLNEERYEAVKGAPTEADEALLSEDLQYLDELPVPEGTIGADKIALLSDMCRFCRDNGIELTVIITPHRSDYYDRYEGFRENFAVASSYLYDVISKRGFMYYNTESDMELHGILPDDYFYDWEHISSEYEPEATEYLYEVIQKRR